MVAVPLALNLPGKFDAGSRVIPVGRIALSQHAATAAETTTRIVDRLVSQVDRSMIPALAARLHETPAAFSHSLALNFPAVASGLAHWPQIRSGGYALAAAQQDSVQPFRDLDGLPFKALPWFVIGPGLLLALLALAGARLGAAPPPAARHRTTIRERERELVS